MSDRETILNQIKADIQDKISPSRGYNLGIAEVVHGIINFDDAILKPVIAYFAVSDEVVDEEIGTSQRYRALNVLFYGYADVELGNYSNIFKLLEDLEKFLDSSDFTYYGDCLIGNSDFVFSPDNLKSMFTLNLRVYYHQNV